jgi:Fe-S-cluster containining protein
MNFVLKPATLRQIRDAWSLIEPRMMAYRLLLPGHPSFICQPQSCDAHCCRAFSVSLGDREVEHMRRSSGLSPAEFLELQDRTPVRLPLANPYLLARRDNHCALLAPDLSCSQYNGRPGACQLYPHFVVAVESGTGRSLRVPGLPALVHEFFAAGHDSAAVPLLLRHAECPGFTGLPLTDEDWTTLFRRTAALQSAVDGHGEVTP